MSKILNLFIWVSSWLYRKNIPLLPTLLTYLIRFLFGAWLPASMSVGRGTVFGYGGLGVVVHARAIIGDDCLVGQGVTIGGTSGYFEVPIIGDNVYIGAGAKILGPISVGDNCIVGANAVVVSDVPSNSLVAGVPAKVIREHININDYK